MSIGTEGQSYQGYLGISEEPSYGGGGSPSVYLPIRSEGFTLGNNPLIDSNIRGRARYLAAAGVLDDDGDLELVAGPENGLGYLLKGTLGSAAVTASDGSGDSTDDTGTHTFVPADTLPSYAVEVGLGSIDAFRHVGSGFDALTLSHTPEEYLVVSTDITAKEPQLQGTQATPTYTDLRPFVWHDGALDLDGTDRTPDLAEFEVELANGIDEKIRGERSPSKAHLGDLEVSGSLNLDFEDTTAAELFLGSTGATSPAQELYKASLNATWTSPEIVAGTQAYELSVDLPAITLSTHEAQLNEQDAILENIGWEAEFDPTAGYEVQFTLINSQTTAY